jgi:phasin family protein
MNKEATQMWEQMNEVGKSTMESMVRFNEIASRSIERMAQQQFAAVGGCFESAINHLKVLGEAKGVQDVFLGQTRLTTECGEKWMETARRVLEISLQAQTELAQWMQDNLNRLNSQAQKTAEQAQQIMQQAA